MQPYEEFLFTNQNPFEQLELVINSSDSENTKQESPATSLTALVSNSILKSVNLLIFRLIELITVQILTSEKILTFEYTRLLVEFINDISVPVYLIGGVKIIQFEQRNK